ncbi:hypothetical protein BG846_03326 [Streptomyces fradiae ATCC 10745 = DSM 40063]|uniref:Uncharacterized protein n=1 Tax=Streptomyces fradiae ATCC 10745 = DSM 40063 TaxID=1319510 RepID=A0A1Y2NVI2_STRFR|nr:hypothetical protein BG846_03326 [Streptomyces fradiae ATCC 10745 = DSM 40063]
MVAGESFGEPGFDQVGAADRADGEGAAGERGDGRAGLLQDVCGVVRGVAGCGEGAQGERGPDVDAVAVVDGHVRAGGARARGDEVGGAGEAGEAGAAGEVVVVEVGLEHMGEADAAGGRRGEDAVHVAGRVDGDGVLRASREVAAVAEPFGLDGVDEEHERSFRLLPGRRRRPRACAHGWGAAAHGPPFAGAAGRTRGVRAVREGLRAVREGAGGRRKRTGPAGPREGTGRAFGAGRGGYRSRGVTIMGTWSGWAIAEAAAFGVWPGAGRSRQRRRIVARAIVASVQAKVSPMHLRLPAPKGM